MAAIGDFKGVVQIVIYSRGDAIMEIMSDFFNYHFNAGARIEAQAGAVGQALEDQGLRQGQMLSASKSYYRDQHPDHEVYFNGCIFIKEPVQWWQFSNVGEWFRPSSYRQVWWGDIDLTASRSALALAAGMCGQDLYVTRERYRFDGYHGESKGVRFFAGSGK